MTSVKTEKNKKVTEQEKISRSASNGMDAVIYNTKGKEAGKLLLPEDVFGLPWNADLVHQVVTSMMSNARQPIAHAKTRGEVRGGGKKPWRQKGTGRARHGSTRSPIWVGGGTTHGPRNEKNYDRKVNKKMKTKALYVILSQKLRDGEVIFIENISISAPKTKDAVKFLTDVSAIKGFEKIDTKKKNAALVGLPNKNEALVKSFRNIGKVTLEEIRNWNPIELLNHTYLVIVEPQASLDVLKSKSK